MWDVAARTPEQMWADWKKYKDMYGNLPRSQRTKSKHKNFTQTHSNSIAHEPMFDFPSECLTKASTHYRLGNNLSILKDMIYPALDKVEELSSGLNSILFRKCVQEVLDKLVAYKQWLSENLSDADASIAGW